jgi:tRNA (mo5U34)-methyltransferase
LKPSIQIPQSFVFDRYGSLSDSRKDFLEWLLPQLKSADEFKTALDVGCAVGFFSDFLRRMGLAVTGVDARADNITEAKKRYPDIRFDVGNVEDFQVREQASLDIVLCLGLLYHLENPFRAVRNLHALAKKLVIIESAIVPTRWPYALFKDEYHGEDQSLAYVAFVPSEACLIKMLYRAGFAAVYKPMIMPNHKDFSATFYCRRKRTILIASKLDLALSSLRRMPEPHVGEIWLRMWAYQLYRIFRFIKKPAGEKWQTIRDLRNRW